MAVTRLKRKLKKNKIRAVKRLERIKQLTKKPIIKNLDIEEIKKSFGPESA
jgi:hypothetical protein